MRSAPNAASVNVDAAKLWNFESGSRKNQPVGHHHQHIQAHGSKQLQRFGRLEVGRLMHGQSEFEGAALDRADMQHLTSARRPVRLRENSRDAVLWRQSLERRNCEVRSAGEAQLQCRGSGAQGSKSRRVSA
jgi:hypothetical protein